MWRLGKTIRQIKEWTDLSARGEYLAVIAGCVKIATRRACRNMQDVSQLTVEQAQTYVFRSRQTKDESRLLAGGEVFDLGPLGHRHQPQPDAGYCQTGLGTWTDEEIKRAFQQNVDIHGHNLFPLMPAHIYNKMADEDADAIVAYLRSLPPVNLSMQSLLFLNIEPSRINACRNPHMARLRPILRTSMPTANT